MTRYRPFTQAWADAVRDTINDDAHYRTVAAEWSWPVALVLEAVPEFGYASDAAVEFALNRGRCTAAAVVDPASLDVPFVLRARYAVWKRIVLGITDPVIALLLRQVTLDGSLSTLMLHAGAAKALVACARRVPTEFPDESA